MCPNLGREDQVSSVRRLGAARETDFLKRPGSEEGIRGGKAHFPVNSGWHSWMYGRGGRGPVGWEAECMRSPYPQTFDLLAPSVFFTLWPLSMYLFTHSLCHSV